MPITLSTLENDRIVYLKVTDPWTTEELLSIYPLEAKYFNNRVGKVHTILDITSMRTIPPTALRARNSPNLTHPNSGNVLVIGATHPLAVALFNVTERLLQHTRFQNVASYDEAVAFLKQQLALEEQPIAQPAPH